MSAQGQCGPPVSIQDLYDNGPDSRGGFKLEKLWSDIIDEISSLNCMLFT